MIVRLFILIVASYALSGCVTEQQLHFVHGDVELFAQRSGCVISDVSVKNNGGKERKVYGEINALTDDGSTQLTAVYSCATVYPGGKSRCESNLDSHGMAPADTSGGLGCPGYAKFINNPKIF